MSINKEMVRLFFTISPELSATLKAIGLVILAVFIFYFFIIKEDEKETRKENEDV